MDPSTLLQLAQQATEILAPALPIVYAGGIAVADKGKQVLGDMMYEKVFEKLGSAGGKRAKALLEKISPKMSASLEKALIRVSENSEDPKAKEELQQEILKLLRQDQDLARAIEFTINFNVENINQFAEGNYNNFFNFETPSGDEFIKIIEYLDQRRKEEINQEIMSRYNPSVLPYYPERLKQFVTENRADELRKALVYLEKHRILYLSGVGGVGKSTLARALVDLRPVNVPKPFWFSFYDNQNAKLGDILEKLAAYMNAPEIVSFKAERREPGKLDVDKLTGELNRERKIWLIFDDLSTILEDQHFADKVIELLFSSLRYNTHNAKIIVTSRILPTLENGESLIDVVEDEEKQHLNGLRKDFAVDYLASNGLKEVDLDKLEKLATGVDGHPLALKLLVELVKEFGVKDTLEDLSMYQESKDDTIKKARKLFDKLAGEEKELLENISVYRGYVGLEGLKEMFTEDTPKNAVKKLIDKSLLETDHNGKYWLHPLVQEFSYDDLENKKEAHILAVKYYLSLPLPKSPTKKEDLQPAIEAHHHACEAGEYDLAAETIWRYDLPDFLDLWGNQRILIETYEKLLPKDHFKDGPVLKNKQVHGAVLGNLGLAYSDLGKSREAIEYYERALKIAREFENRQGERNNLGNLGNAYSDLGNTKKAIEYYERSLKISREIGDKQGESADLGNLGSAYNDLGDTKKAIEYYERALKISLEIGDKHRESADLGNLGLAYNDLGDTKKAIEYYERALKISQEIGDKRRKGTYLGNLGNAYSQIGEITKAIEFYEKALEITKEIGDKRGEGRNLGNMGIAYRQLGKTRKAIECYEKSLIIAEETDYIRGEVADLRNLGNAYSDLKDTKKAINYYEQALKISKKIGDKCGEGVDLGNLGLAYSWLNNPRKAIEYYEEALKIAEEVGDRRIEGVRLGNLGNAYSDLGDTKKAIKFYEKALEIAKEIGDKRRISAYIANLGNEYRQYGEIEKAVGYYEKALELAKELGDKRGISAYIANLGLIYTQQGQKRKGIELLKRALEIGKSIEDQEIIHFCIQELQRIEFSDLDVFKGEDS